MDCLFCKIVEGSIPSQKVFENEQILAFKDIQPAAPVHVLIIPKKHIATMNDVAEEDLPLVAEMHKAAQQIAKELGVADTLLPSHQQLRAGQRTSGVPHPLPSARRGQIGRFDRDFGLARLNGMFLEPSGRLTPNGGSASAGPGLFCCGGNARLPAVADG